MQRLPSALDGKTSAPFVRAHAATVAYNTPYPFLLLHYMESKCTIMSVTNMELKERIIYERNWLPPFVS